MWAVTVRRLRQGLIPKGWSFSETGNYSRTISSDGGLVIVVATGDEATGLRDGTPTTQSRKGPRTLEVIATNANQLDLPFEWPEDVEPTNNNSEAMTWIMLSHWSADSVRAELSRPISYDDALRVSGWYERIILPPVEIQPDDAFEFGPDEAPDVDVVVRRRQ